MTYNLPNRPFYSLYADMLRQPHVLIAGTTGSGKSVVINGMMYAALQHSPAAARFILLDPKRVELIQYSKLPHVLLYASEPDTMRRALQQALDVTEQRYKVMQAQGARKYTGPDLYVVIDELADLMTTDKKHVKPLLQRLCQIGRAARVHVIAATQCPLATIIPTEIKVNFDARVGLRTRSAQDSRNILGQACCEDLPRYGQGYYMTPEGCRRWRIPMHSDEQIDSLVAYWTDVKKYIA